MRTKIIRRGIGEMKIIKNYKEAINSIYEHVGL